MRASTQGLPRLLLLAWLLAAATADHVVAQAPVDFQRDVRPLLADRCFACHGPDAAHRKAGLRLDQVDGPEGAYRAIDGVAAVVPNDPAASEVWRRITSDDADVAMPPADSHKPRLDAEQRETIRRWIQAGAPYQTHWSFRAPVSPTLPTPTTSTTPAWRRHPIDRLVLASLRKHGLEPSPRADRRSLIRRVTLDLTGLPPTLDEVREFVADDSEGAYERLVDDLLQRPQYGEHRARYWLDLVRLADTNGIHHDHYRDLSPYRDWVIRSFRDNLPFDQFVTHQLAGDLLDNASEDQLVASGLHRLHRIIDVGTALPEESLARNVIDRTATFGTAFLGLTVECAQCHDHKYDPILHEDFYRFAAFFNNLDGKPETGGRRGTDFRRGLQKPYINLPSEEQRARLADANQAIEQARDNVQHAKRLVALGKSLAPAGFARGLSTLANADLKSANRQVKARQQQRDQILMQIPAAMVMKERDQLRPQHVFLRGNYDQPGKQVERGTPAFLPPLEKGDAVASRLDLANWLTSSQHPLTARVAVNRFWQQLFGIGIVETAEDLGSQGTPPSHPELLDYLAVRFVQSGWNVKLLIREIVTSATYQQSSVATREQFVRDPDNRQLARGSRYRLDAEMIRDQILHTSGLLSPKMFGPSVKPPQPAGIWKAVTLPDSLPRTYRADEGEAARRRSIYTFWKRGLPPPQMTILNAPARESCIARRERTNTPLQALLLLNEGEYLKAARNLARTGILRMPREPDRLAFLFETITSHLPNAAEQEVLMQSLQDMREHYRRHPALAARLCGEERDVEATELAAWTMVASTIYNLDITKTKQ